MMRHPLAPPRRGRLRTTTPFPNTKRRPHAFDKQQILSMISDPSQAELAAQQLPDTIDHEQHGALLQQFGIDPNQLASSTQGRPGESPGGPVDTSGSGTSDQTNVGDAGQGGSSGF